MLDKEKIVLIVYDFDGVMTDNHAWVDQDGREMACVHRGDGLGVGLIRKAGFQQMILSTEVNPIVAHRAEKLKLPVIHNVPDKAAALKAHCEKEGIDLATVLYIGNDVNDLEAMQLCGQRGAPADAEAEILDIANWISAKRGGYGVVRELARLLTQDGEG